MGDCISSLIPIQVAAHPSYGLLVSVLTSFAGGHDIKTALASGIEPDFALIPAEFCRGESVALYLSPLDSTESLQYLFPGIP